MASIAELNAGVEKANVSLRKLVDSLAPNKDYPFVGNPHTMALRWLASPEGKAVVLDEVKQIAAAMEEVRAKEAAAKPAA